MTHDPTRASVTRRVFLHRMAMDGSVLAVLVSAEMAMHVSEEPLTASLFLTAGHTCHRQGTVQGARKR